MPAGSRRRWRHCCHAMVYALAPLHSAVRGFGLTPRC